MLWSIFGIISLFLLLEAVVSDEPETGNHVDWPRWCGKVYKAGYPSFDPSGQTVDLPAVPDAPLLHLRLQPRWSLYVDIETVGHFVVDTELSQQHGERFPDGHSRAGMLDLVIKLDRSESVLAQGSIEINSTGNVFTFPLRAIEPSRVPYNVTLTAKIADVDSPEYRAQTELFYLPDKPPGSGSITRLDNRNGGVYFKNKASDNRFVPFFAYGFYSADYGFLENNDTAGLDFHANIGLSAMIPLAQYPKSAFAFEHLDKINLRYQYDLRENYKNLTWVEENVLASRDNDAIYSYWTADEPDGHQDPFSKPRDAYNLIRRLDPYHPVSVVLNCQDYYFGPYSAPSDIITTDPYPIGINTTLSKWGTTCNTTLGDCGCDNCRGGAHAIKDVRDRLDTFAQYERRLGRWPKTKVHVLQSFHGEDYWARDPTSEEIWAMALVAVNHGARGLSSWVYPAPDVLMEAHGRLAKVLTRSPVVDVLMGAEDGGFKVEVSGYAELDVVYWVEGADMVVSVVNPTYDAVNAEVELVLPGAGSIERVLWGDITWELKGARLVAAEVPALGTSIVLLKAGPEK